MEINHFYTYLINKNIKIWLGGTKKFLKENPCTIFHLASVVSAGAEADWEHAIDQNIGGMLRLLEEQELGVGELARIVQLPQSTVSRHLKALHDHNWIVKRSEGTASLYRLHRESLEGDQLQIWETRPKTN